MSLDQDCQFGLNVPVEGNRQVSDCRNGKGKQEGFGLLPDDGGPVLVWIGRWVAELDFFAAFYGLDGAGLHRTAGAGVEP